MTSHTHTRTRLFTNEFEVGMRVSIIRAEHGWHDGQVSGVITHMTGHTAVVRSDEGVEYDIRHPRDIHLDIHDKETARLVKQREARLLREAEHQQRQEEQAAKRAAKKAKKP